MTFLRVFLVLYIPNIVAYMRGKGQGQGRARLEVDYLAEEAAQRCQEAGFMGVDVIRMPFKNIPTLILLFNFYIYIILLLEIDNSIIIGLKIMNLNILLLNF